MTSLAVMVVAAYLVGSVSSAIVVCRALGVADPREVGSRNPGATNVLRYAGRKPAAITLVGDTGKGVLPVLAGQALGIAPAALGLVGLAAFLGHLYPLYYRFAGGKGVATFIGVILALDPWLGACFAGVWLALALALRYSSLAALCAAGATPVAAAWLGHPAAVIAALALMTVLVFWRHRLNIRRLVSGTEPKIGQKT